MLRYTRLGVRIRAGTLDLETVAALGINVQMLRTLNFGVGIYLAGLSGVLAAGQLGLEPTMGTGLLMPSFIATIVGGIGSLPGKLMGGLGSVTERQHAGNPVHVTTRKSLGLMMRKLSVTESQRSAQFRGTFPRRKPRVASANWAQVA